MTTGQPSNSGRDWKNVEYPFSFKKAPKIEVSALSTNFGLAHWAIWSIPANTDFDTTYNTKTPGLLAHTVPNSTSLPATIKFEYHIYAYGLWK